MFSSQQIQKLPINEIIVGNRKREAVNIDSLVESILDLGLLNPITVNRNKVLIAGYHRLEACKKLGWQEIPVIIVDFDNSKTEMAQIDENIVRNQLTVLENAVQLKRRKELFETIHYFSSKENLAKRNLKQFTGTDIMSAPVNVKPFTKDTAEKTGKTDRTIRRYIQIGSGLSKEIVEILTNTTIEDSFLDLEALAAIKDVEKQKQLIQKVISGEFKTIRAALNKEKTLNLPQAEKFKSDFVPLSAYKKLREEFEKLEIEYFKVLAENENLKKAG